MKKLASLIFFASIAVMACNSQSPEEKQEDKPVVKEEAKEVKATSTIKLNKQKFLEHIVDYETNPQEWIYKGELPGLVDFYADWCRPCRITSPILEELATEYEGKIHVFKVDVQTEKELAAVFGIQSLPSFLFIPMDDNPVMSSGIASTPDATKAMFKQQIDEILLKEAKNPN